MAKDLREIDWFLLYDGSSVDGRGRGTYAGRTTSLAVATEFYNDNIKDDPYATGHVLRVTPYKTERWKP